MEIDENEEFTDQMTYKKQWAYFNMLKKRGAYLLKHLKKIEADFLKKYKSKNSSQKQFLVDVKIIFNIYEILVSEIISDLQFTELENFGQGIKKLFEQIIMIISYLIQSFIIKTKQSSAKQIKQQRPQQPKIVSNQQIINQEKKRYEINQKTIYNLKEETRLYDVMQDNNEDLKKLQEQVMSKKEQCLQIKHSSLQANLKEAYQYLNKYTKFSKTLLDKTQKRLKQQADQLQALENIDFFAEETKQIQHKKEAMEISKTQIQRLKQKGRVERAMQTQKEPIPRKSLNLDPKHIKKYLEQTKDEIQRLHQIITGHKLRHSEEQVMRQKLSEELYKEKQRTANLNEMINEYKECVKYRDNVIKNLKEKTDQLVKNQNRYKLEQINRIAADQQRFRQIQMLELQNQNLRQRERKRIFEKEQTKEQKVQIQYVSLNNKYKSKKVDYRTALSVKPIQSTDRQCNTDVLQKHNQLTQFQLLCFDKSINTQQYVTVEAEMSQLERNLSILLSEVKSRVSLAQENIIKQLFKCLEHLEDINFIPILKGFIQDNAITQKYQIVEICKTRPTLQFEEIGIQCKFHKQKTRFSQSSEQNELEEKKNSNLGPSMIIINTIKKKAKLSCYQLYPLLEKKQSKNFITQQFCESTKNQGDFQQIRFKQNKPKILLKRNKSSKYNNRKPGLDACWKQRTIIQLYKVMSTIRYTKPQKFEFYANILNLPKNVIKTCSYEQFTIFASKFVDKHVDCYANNTKECPHIKQFLQQL